jgi:hypothetical protein
LDTLYPFRDKGVYTVKTSAPIEFALEIRIPASVKSATVDGKPAQPGSIVSLHRVWEGESTVELSMEFDIVFEKRPREMAVLRRGPLYYSVAIEEDWKMYEYTRHGVVRKFPYCDYEILPTTPFAYGIAAREFLVVETEVTSDMPFAAGGAPIALEALMAPVEWKVAENGLCAPLPESNAATGDAMTLRLIPYGCTRLRMTALPLIEK